MTKENDRYISKKNKIENSMNIQKVLYSPEKGSVKKKVFQFTFNEDEGEFNYYLVSENKKCTLNEGLADKYKCRVVTDIETWSAVGNGFLSGKDAMKNGKFKIEGKLFSFLISYNKFFSGTTKIPLKEGVYFNSTQIDRIKNVLVISSSPRKDTGATELFTSHYINGLKKAGANVELLYAEDMNITPCKGCFKCWVNNLQECIYHKKDDMKIFWEKFFNSDLIVWATPIYVFHCTTAMKTIMDRLFISTDPHIIENKNKKDCHPKKDNHYPYMSLLAVCGFNDNDSFEPLVRTFEILSDRVGYKLIGPILRNSAMAFLNNEHRNKKCFEVLNAFEKAGEETILNRKISAKTKKIAEQSIMSRNFFLSVSNYLMDQMQESHENPFIYEK